MGRATQTISSALRIVKLLETVMTADSVIRDDFNCENPVSSLAVSTQRGAGEMRRRIEGK
jgi:hypothetical protein